MYNNSLIRPVKAKKKPIINSKNERWVRTLQAEGYTYGEIAKLLDCSRSTVYKFFFPEKFQIHKPSKEKSNEYARQYNQRKRQQKKQQLNKIKEAIMPTDLRLINYTKVAKRVLKKKHQKRINFFERAINEIDQLEDEWISRNQVVGILSRILLEVKQEKI